MAKRVISFISFGISMLILLLFMMTTFTASGSDVKAMLLVLVFTLPFIILGLIGGLQSEKRRTIAGIFMILAGISTTFLGLMTCAGGLQILGILALPLGIVSFILYIISAILTFIKK